MSNVLEILGQNLVRLRNEKGLDRKQLSALLGLSEIELEGIEAGTTDVDTDFLNKAATILQVEPEDFFSSESSRNQLLDLIKNKLDTCSEKDLAYIFDYISGILNK